MSQHAGSADEEGIHLTYSSLSSLPPGKRLPTPLAALPHNGEPEPEPVLATWGAWPHSYRRALNLALLGALFALGVVLGTVVSGYAVSLHSPPGSLPSSSPMLSRPNVTSTLAAQHRAVGTVPEAAVAVDARFAVVTLGIGCIRDLCDTPDATKYVPAGQRVRALQGDWSCTTLSAVTLRGHTAQDVYCRLEQPNVFASTFDGAQFDCVGSWLGCHFVAGVETTNGR
jgi:hypothetical protein